MSKIIDNVKEDNVTIFIIGDPHIRVGNMEEGRLFVEKAVESAEKINPTFTVILGDTLHKHGVADVDPHILACEFIHRLSIIAPVYLLIGNHDLANQCQFLTNRHFFTPLKKWKNVTVVDKPICDEIGGMSFVFCPYVEPGRFIEALNSLIKEGEMWDFSDCIFAHQEFYGCQMGAIKSEIGDVWDSDYPPVISGHIHNAQTVGENIFYPGSAIQHAFGEDPDKRLWKITFGAEDPPYFSIDKINLGMKGKKIVRTKIENVDSFDTSLTEKYHIKLSIKGTSDQFKVFRTTKKYGELRNLGIKFAYVRTDNEDLFEHDKKSRGQTSFPEMLREVVQTKTEDVKEVYQELMNEEVQTKIIYELVFRDSDESDECNSDSDEHLDDESDDEDSDKELESDEEFNSNESEDSD